MRTLDDELDELHRAWAELWTKVDAQLGLTRLVAWLARRMDEYRR